ncbi:hypothetical protein ABER23_25465 [Paenibacillus lautus]|uniref:hypothetical protein n=1 Tax=Paenibacillus lautus TaxID=1401 RepID=UPI003D2D997B
MAKAITAQEMDSATASGLVPHLGTTTNSGNSYSVTSNMPISTNQKFTIKFNVASSTAPTLKINNDTALPIKKANGNNAKLYASVYTLFRDGSAFILQGEGGGGNVQTNQVEAGFTFTNDSGEQTGTLSKQAFIDQIRAKGVTVSNSDPFNILAAKIGQIVLGRKYATGYITSSSEWVDFLSELGDTGYASSAQFDGLNFWPSIIVITLPIGTQVNVRPSHIVKTVYTSQPRNVTGLASVQAFRISGSDGFSIDGTKAYVTERGFRLPVLERSANLTWHAIE